MIRGSKAVSPGDETCLDEPARLRGDFGGRGRRRVITAPAFAAGRRAGPVNARVSHDGYGYDLIV